MSSKVWATLVIEPSSQTPVSNQCSMLPGVSRLPCEIELRPNLMTWKEKESWRKLQYQLTGSVVWLWSQHPTRSEFAWIPRILTRQSFAQSISCLLDELLPKLSRAKVFSTLDAKDGFYQVGLHENISLKTTFWTL